MEDHTFMRLLTLSGPGRRIILPHIQNVINFERLVVLTWNFMTISFVPYFADVGTFIGRTYFYSKKWFYFVHAWRNIFHI